jgi:hypothetical protein
MGSIGISQETARMREGLVGHSICSLEFDHLQVLKGQLTIGKENQELEKR